MRDALATLPWVEPNSITTVAKTRQVRFTVKSKSSFNESEIKKVLGSRYNDRMKVLAGPTDS